MRNRYDNSLLSYILLTTCFVFFGDALSPGIKIAFYAPLIVACYYRLPYIYCIWTSLGCGLVLDILSSQHMFAMHTLVYCLSTALTFRHKQHFYDDSISTIPVLTAIFSGTATILQLIVLYIQNMTFTITWRWILTDLILMSLLDSLYAFSCFTLPFILLKLRPKRPRSFTIKRPQ
jgi:hypothetical protein